MVVACLVEVVPQAQGLAVLPSLLLPLLPLLLPSSRGFLGVSDCTVKPSVEPC